jgi:N-acetylmuramoyl-L-alanine amidase
VKRDPAKRRYRHHWERAIRSLELAARGRDRPVALLEAARARYALYRFSAIEADRAQALRLAGLARDSGSRDAPGLAAAIRREMGDDDRSPPRRRGATARAGKRPPAPPAHREVERQPPADEESTDPELDRVVTEVLRPAEVTSEPVASTLQGGGRAEGGPAHVSEIKTWSSPDYTRVAVHLSRPVDHQETEIAPAGEQPRRLAVDLTPAQLAGKAMARPVGDAQVERVRAAQHDADTVRVVLDLAGDQDYELFRLEDPPRLVVDVGTRQAAPPAPAAAAGPEDEGEGGPGRPIRRVVVDAGHGGHDPGAIGPGGVREKDVTLAMARRLRRKLERAGFEVVLTRRDDRTLDLPERTVVANTARGDLFVSLHANAHPRRDRAGVETYFLNVTDDRYASRLAARENGLVELAGGAVPQVKRILSDLNATRSAVPSRRLAGLVQRELVSRVRANVGEVRDLGVKHALFYVLLGARMPAVLVETAFVSNRAEERRLASARYQEEVAEGVARAIAIFAGRDASRVAVRSLRAGEPALYP